MHHRSNDKSKSRMAKRTAPVKPVSSNQSRSSCCGVASAGEESSQGRQQHHQQSIAACQPVKSAAADVARQTFVLPGKGIQRQANQQHHWQQPQPAARKLGWRGSVSRSQKLNQTAKAEAERRCRSETDDGSWDASEQLVRRYWLNRNVTTQDSIARCHGKGNCHLLI